MDMNGFAIGKDDDMAAASTHYYENKRQSLTLASFMQTTG